MMNEEIQIPFVEVIYKKSLVEFIERNQSFVNKALYLKKVIPQANEWRCNTFSTINSYDLRKDPLFKDLINACEQETTKFAKEFGVEIGLAKCIDAWINVGEQGAYQEYHSHPKSHFSLSYYVNTPADCGNIVFRSHECDTDMFPLTYQKLLPPSYKTYGIQPQAGDVVIFRSNLRHMVELNKSALPRISISMNMVI